MSLETRSFTRFYRSSVNVINSDVGISQAFGPENIPSALPQLKNYNGIWDTGASASAITQKVVDDCDLKPIGIARVITADGPVLCDRYMVNIYLPNGVAFSEVMVTQGRFTGADVLIGMDIVGKSDFAITNKNGLTTFSFRVPSIEWIDFVNQKPHEWHNIGRNDPCPCQSGKKFKKCHGIDPDPNSTSILLPPTPPSK